MHTFWHRANTVLTFGSTVLAFLCILATFSDYFHNPTLAITANVSGVDGLQRDMGSDRAWIDVNLNADLRDVFSWNTKQVYVFLMVEFTTKKNHLNQAVLWNRIIERKEEANLRIPVLRPDYPFQITDQGYNLRGKPFNVTLAWNVMPKVGALYTQSKSFSGFQFPAEYVRADQLGGMRNRQR